MADFPRYQIVHNARGKLVVTADTMQAAKSCARWLSDSITEYVPLPEVERIIRETCAAWRERDSAMSVDIENELLDALKDG